MDEKPHDMLPATPSTRYKALNPVLCILLLALFLILQEFLCFFILLQSMP